MDKTTSGNYWEKTNKYTGETHKPKYLDSDTIYFTSKTSTRNNEIERIVKTSTLELENDILYITKKYNKVAESTSTLNLKYKNKNVSNENQSTPTFNFKFDNENDSNDNHSTPKQNTGLIPFKKPTQETKETLEIDNLISKNNLTEEQKKIISNLNENYKTCIFKLNTLIDKLQNEKYKNFSLTEDDLKTINEADILKIKYELRNWFNEKPNRYKKDFIERLKSYDDLLIIEKNKLVDISDELDRFINEQNINDSNEESIKNDDIEKSKSLNKKKKIIIALNIVLIILIIFAIVILPCVIFLIVI